MADHKALPAIPMSPNQSGLSILAREHRSRFVRQALSEGAQVSFSESLREAWCRALEGALDELGDNIARGGWLAGIKRGRTSRNARTATTATARVEADKVRKLQEDPVKDKKKLHNQGSSNTHDSSEQDSQEGLGPKVLPTGDSTEGHDDCRTRLALKQIRELVSHPTLPAPEPAANHLLLCVAPLGSRIALAPEDNGFNLSPAQVGCAFTVGIYSLPEINSDHRDAKSIFLYGLDEWDASAFSSEGNTTRLVGGTFTFRGANSLAQQYILLKALRIATYVHLSLLLEQYFLLNSNVQLHFPKPRLPPPSMSFQEPSMDRSSSTPESKSRNRNTFLPSGILSFFSKKSFSHRASTISPILGRGGSIDLGISLSSPDRHDRQGPQLLEADTDGPLRRRFSFRSDVRPSFLRSTQGKEHPDPPFSSALKCIEQSKDLLSTSAGVSFPPPTLILDLTEKEKAAPDRRLKGDEKVGLTSILGWDGKDAQGKGMCGTLGFVRQQGLSVLYSEYVPSLPSPAPEPPSSSSKSSSTTLDPPRPIAVRCDRARWITYRYYSHKQGEDMSLGETILNLVSAAQLPCKIPGCQFKRKKHEVRYVHGGIRIVVKVEDTIEADKDGDNIDMWESCAVCAAKTDRNKMSDGTYLLSFSKFLELLIYSPALCAISPSLCEHTTPPPPWPDNNSPLPRSRLNIVRHFSSRAYIISFSLSLVEDIFEFRVPRLQITRSNDKNTRNPTTLDDKYVDNKGDEEKKVLRREIKLWWEGVADHVDKLEDMLTGDNLVAFRKALPRLPSDDDPYDEEIETPKAISDLPPLPPSIPNSPSHAGPPEKYFPKLNSATSASPASSASTSQKQSDLVHLLSTLRHTFQRTEQSLYTQLSRTPASSLNDVRRSFLSASHGASRRLVAWQNKHLPPMVKAQLTEQIAFKTPEWWSKDCHAVPGGNVIVREGDWGSIIAFTMGTTDYQRELANMSTSRPTSNAQSITPTPPAVANSSFFSAATGFKFFTSSALAQPDPDQEDVIWHEPEAYTAVITRKDHPRDPTSLLPFREVLRLKSPIDSSSGLPASRFSSISSTTSRAIVGAPPSAWAKPNVQVSMQAADGEVSGLPKAVAGRILQEIESVSAESSRPSSAMSGSYGSSSGFIDAHIRRGKASSIISVESNMTIGPDNGSSIQLPMPPAPPPKDTIKPGDSRCSVEDPSFSLQPTASPSSFANTLTSSLTNAMRFMLNTVETPRPLSPSSKNHHGLLSADSSSIDERPHIKYDWTIGKRLKFSCTVYYAKQFDLLRRRCGIDDIFLKSLSRSANWAAEGGKSKSNFWKTSDDRFIIKTLVNAWNVADLQVLIELAPSYFRYMDATASKATVLAKLIGFYTIEIRNLENGTVQSKADLLVMENLFYNQKVVKTFDLKGIQGRKVKAGSSTATSALNSRTLFDGEWIEGQQRTLTLVHPHSKAILREAIKSDAEFLSKCNIMDYSLLLGVDEERKLMACGLVDTIGSYTFAKTLEYKAKQGLNANKDVTVIPPAEYQERFVNALDGYFVACPDKWSRPLDETKVISDSDLLPSVL